MSELTIDNYNTVMLKGTACFRCICTL